MDSSSDPLLLCFLQPFITRVLTSSNLHPSRFLSSSAQTSFVRIRPRTQNNLHPNPTTQNNLHPNPTTQNKSSGVLFSDSLLDLRLPSLSDLCRSVNLSPASNHGHGVSAWKSESLLSRLGLYQYSTVGVGWGRLSVLSSSPSNCFLRLLWFVLFPLVYQSSDFFGIGEALVSFSAVDFGHPPVTGVVRIFVGGLGESVTDDDLRNIFSSLSRGLGKVETVEIIRTKGRSFAYMNFFPLSHNSLSSLFSTYNGCVWKGGKLRLEKAKDDYLSRLKKEWDEEEEEEN